MDILFLKGLCIGVLVALPSGPVGFLTIRRVYLFGLRSGMYSAVGAVLTDAFYGVVVGFGLREISRFLVSVSGIAEAVAGVSLVWVAYRSFGRSIDLRTSLRENHPLGDIVSSALLNLLNPALVFSFTTLFLMIGIGRHIGHPGEIGVFLSGIAAGTLGFWYGVGRAIVHLREREKGHWVDRVNRVTAALLGAVGVLLLVLALVRLVR